MAALKQASSKNQAAKTAAAKPSLVASRTAVAEKPGVKPPPKAGAALRALPPPPVMAKPPLPVVKPVTPLKPLAAPKPVAAPEVVGDSQPVPAFKGKAQSGPPKQLVLVGAIGGAFGVKGEVRLRAFTQKREGVISYGPLYGEDGKILLRPKSYRDVKDGVAVVTPEVKTREQAEKMRGTRLYIPRANLPQPAQDEFYIVDLLGCKAEALDGTALGEIVAVWNFGAGDILEYRPAKNGPNVRIIFSKETVPMVDLAGKRVVLDPPAPEPVG